MCGVGVAVYVHLYGCVDGYHTETAYHLGVVRYLALAQHEVLLEEVDVVIYLLETLVRHSQRACRCVLHTAFEYHGHDGVLQHLCVYVEVGDILVLREGVEDSVGRRAYT